MHYFFGYYPATARFCSVPGNANGAISNLAIGGVLVAHNYLKYLYGLTPIRLFLFFFSRFQFEDDYLGVSEVCDAHEGGFAGDKIKGIFKKCYVFD